MNLQEGATVKITAGYYAGHAGQVVEVLNGYVLVDIAGVGDRKIEPDRLEVIAPPLKETYLRLRAVTIFLDDIGRWEPLMPSNQRMAIQKAVKTLNEIAESLETVTTEE
ncbi:MAG: hypothetical protein GTO55_07475 [Armatimonadetes bacterium]|nr:hypothetical protein [Armatimonadota bacterium]NIM24109.1 hypothetical protein [Armatimonadota bacterium]NIM67964.1 hypothetical protein [Armatimonadota bacterium]NIN06193.1 hypothetical protein [Armatimonadota bacterium]NIO97632.1 hypothetical protein [Armatimonadota bacterium]